MELKYFSIFKNNKKDKPAQPDYIISAKIGEEYKSIGGGWIKEGTKGKYISCKVEPYEKPKEATVNYPQEEIDAEKIPF